MNHNCIFIFPSRNCLLCWLMIFLSSIMMINTSILKIVDKVNLLYFWKLLLDKVSATNLFDTVISCINIFQRRPSISSYFPSNIFSWKHPLSPTKLWSQFIWILLRDSVKILLHYTFARDFIPFSPILFWSWSEDNIPMNSFSRWNQFPLERFLHPLSQILFIFKDSIFISPAFIFPK